MRSFNFDSDSSVYTQVAADLRGVAGWREAKRKGDVNAALWLVDGERAACVGRGSMCSDAPARQETHALVCVNHGALTGALRARRARQGAKREPFPTRSWGRIAGTNQHSTVPRYHACACWVSPTPRAGWVAAEALVLTAPNMYIIHL